MQEFFSVFANEVWPVQVPLQAALQFEPGEGPALARLHPSKAPTPILPKDEIFNAMFTFEMNQLPFKNMSLLFVSIDIMFFPILLLSLLNPLDWPTLQLGLKQKSPLL